MTITFPPSIATDLAATGRRIAVPDHLSVDKAGLLALLRSARCAKVPRSRRPADAVLERLDEADGPGGPRIELRRPVEDLADLLAIAEHITVPLAETVVCYVGDGQAEQAHSLLMAGALIGMDVRVAAPLSLWPDDGIVELAEDLAAGSGARVLVTSDARHAVLGADIVVAGAWGNWSVLPFDEVAPPGFTVSEAFVAASGLSTTVTLTVRPNGRAARTAPRSVALDQVRNRRVLEEVLLMSAACDISGPKVLPTQGTEALSTEWPAYDR